MGFRLRKKSFRAGVSPSRKAMTSTQTLATNNGGVTVDFEANVENIKEVSRDLEYNALSDATFVYVPSSYGESKNFTQQPIMRNLAKFSEEYNDAVWAKTGAVITANSTTDPIGGNSADLVDFTNAAGGNNINQAVNGSFLNGDSYVFTVYVKAFDATQIGKNLGIRFQTAPTPQTVINLTGGWDKVSVTITLNANQSILNLRVLDFGISNPANKFYIWGAQLEKGSTATPYQRTTDAISDFTFTRATTERTTNKLGVIESSCYNLLLNSATGTTQSITVEAGTYDLSFFGTGNYVLSGAATGTKTGTGLTTRSSFSVVCTSGSLTLTASGTITNTQFSLGSQRDYLKTTNRLNVPCLSYDRSLLEPSLLKQPQRTNLALQSETFSSSSWSKINTTISINTNANPFNTNKSYYLSETLVNGSQALQQIFNITNGIIYTTSWYVKKADDSWVQLAKDGNAFSSTAVWQNFNFDTGLFGNNGGVGSWTKKQLINGYWLITVTATATAANATAGMGIIIGTNNTDSLTRGLVYTGTLRNICDVAAIQLEVGSNATSYIPTTTATVTRNGGTSYVDLFNNNMLNQNNFTLFVEGYLYGSGANAMFGLSDSSLFSPTNNVFIYAGGFRYYVGGSFTTVSSAMSVNAIFRAVIQVNGTSVKFFRNGSQIGATQTITNFNYRYLVLTNGDSTFATDKIFLFNRTFSDSEAIDITS